MTTKENPAPRGNAANRNHQIQEQRSTCTTRPVETPDFAAAYVAERYRLPVPIGGDRAPRGAWRGAVMTNGSIDFAEINRAALDAFPAVLARVLPGGKRVGSEVVALNPRRADRNLGSFKVNRFNGRWCDFATGDKGGDVVSLVAYLEGVSRRSRGALGTHAWA